MNIRLALGCATLLSSMVLSMGTVAQVYETTDEEGNVSFSDTPTPGAEKVDIHNTNTAESVEVRPYTPAAPEPEQSAPEPVGAEEGPTMVGGNDELEDLMDRKRAHDIRENIRDHVGDKPTAQPHPAPARPAGGRR